MGFFSKIKEAILGESVEQDNLNEDMDLNEAEALEEDFDALDEEMDYVDEALAAGDSITTHKSKGHGNFADLEVHETLIGKQPHKGAKPLFVDRTHSEGNSKFTHTVPYKDSYHAAKHDDYDEEHGSLKSEKL